VNKLIKVLIPIIFIFLSFLFSYLLVRYNSKIDDLEIIEDGYILNLIGILMGLSIAVITFLFTTTEKIRANLPDKNLNIAIIKEIEDDLRNLYKSIMKDTIAIFISFFLLLICILIKGIDFQLSFLGFSMKDLVLLIKLALLFITLFALLDIILCLFSIITRFNKS